MTLAVPPNLPRKAPPPLRVLLIENDPLDAELAMRELTRAGFSLSANLIQTREELEERFRPGAYDIVLADYNLPGWNGMDALAYLQERGEDVPFVLVSGALGDEAAVECIKRGAWDYVLKQRLGRLPVAVRRALDEKALRAERARVDQETRRLNRQLERRVAERTDQLEGIRREQNVILNSTGEGITRVSLDNRCTFINAAAAKALGWEPGELIGKSLHAIVHHSKADGSPYPAEECPVRASIVDGGTHSVTDEVFWRKDGRSFPVEYVSIPVHEKGKVVGAVVTFRDVTERRAVEKMKEEFISVVSHELRTPLTSIRGALGLLASGKLAHDPVGGQRMLEIAVGATDRLMRMIDDILDLERMASGRVTMAKKACDAAELMVQAAEVMRPLAENAGVVLAVAPQPAELWADPDRIVQTLTNLLSNAIKFSPAGTTVFLDAEGRRAKVVFRVKDSGRGIPPDKLDSIFGRFQQVDASDARKKGGAGLGLAICRSIVQQHGGRIWVESGSGTGSTFFFTLPVRQEPGLPSGVAIPGIPSLAVGPQHEAHSDHR